MKRSIFLVITAIIAFLFGGMMLLMPAKAAEGFGMGTTPELFLMFRALGALVLSMGLLNFMARNDQGSIGLKAILVFNIVGHFLSIIVDAAAAILPFSKSLPGYIAHIFIGVGSLIYLVRMRRW